MAYPDLYEISYSFTDFQEGSPTTPLPADKFHIELGNIGTSISQIITSLKAIQRSDNQLANRSVGVEQLKTEVTLGLNSVDTWVTGTNYSVNDAVYQGNYVYRCIVAHQASVFATDLAANYWEVIVNFEQFINQAIVAQTAAEAAQTASETAQSGAETAQAAAEAAQAAAEAAQAATAALLDQFDDRYLGPKTSDPAVDNDGNALIDGALYFDTTLNVMKIYDLGTTTWLAFSLGLQNIIEDLTPQLGGDLDVNGKKIASVSNGNVVIEPHGTGAVVLKGISMPVADGTAGQAIVTDGAGNASFSDVGGGLVLLGSYTAASATSVDIGSGLDLDTLIDGTYDEYLMVFNLLLASDSNDIILRTSTDGGSTFDSGSTDYNLSGFFMLSDSSSLNGIGTELSSFALTGNQFRVGNAATEGVSGRIILSNLASTTRRKHIDSEVFHGGVTGQAGRFSIKGTRKTTTAVDALRLAAGSGNISSGYVHFYGIKKS